MRVTDLDKFALEEIWRPYQTMLEFGGEHGLAKSPMSLDRTAERLREDTEWSRCVLSRLAGIGVNFPAYINSPLVDAVLAGIKAASGT